MLNPTPGRRPAWVSDELFPFASHFARIDGHTVHYIDEGEGPVLLLYHGNPTWSFLYRDIIRELRADFRCVAFDYPGMGLSTAAAGFSYRAAELAGAAEAFVEHLNLRAITPMVQDWGGPIGLAAAIRQPHRYRALIIGNTWGWPASELNERVKNRAFSTLWGGPLGRTAVKHSNLFAKMILPAGHKRRRLTDEEMAHYLLPFADPASRTPCSVLPREIVRAKNLLGQVAAGLEQIESLPALIVWADKDFAFKESARRRWESTFRTHVTHTLQGAGHFLQDDAGDEVAGAIREWRASLPPILGRHLA
jgi:haloalkane dehalogenase